MGEGILILTMGIVFSFLGMILFAISRLKQIENRIRPNYGRQRLKSTRGYV
jgi:Na+-transporting methylmalonyl-CoA/oxaloacetate decarboxylase gamma subunit